MENNNKITFASIEERKEFLIDMESLVPHSECCIYNVPKDLCRVNEEAYSPQVLSVGPLHYGKPELAKMEKQKIRYRREFSKRINMEKWQEIITFIESHEQRICNCYEEMPDISKVDFIAMILHDAIFIIELFLRYHNEVKNDFLLSRMHVAGSIICDLQLLENQLPYFILNGLYMLAFPEPNRNGNSYPSFFSLSCEFFSDEMMNGAHEEVEVKHFVDLRRHIITKTYARPKLRGPIRNFPSALKLQGSGVKFKVIEGKGPLEIKFEKKRRCNCAPIPCLEIHELQIPLIQISDVTECLIRNMMALEQCHYQSDTRVCNYIQFMDHLINTEEDVSLLVEEGIISNYLGDAAKIKNMFNNLGQRIGLSPSCYYDTVKDLTAHYKNPQNHAKATLKRTFSNLWRGTGTVAAVVFLLLTLIQAITSIFEVV